MKNKDWEIDDTVYFLCEAAHIGDFPKILQGYVEEITRTHLRIKLSKGSGMLTVDKKYCYKNLPDLCLNLKWHIDSETERLTGYTFM